MHYHCIGLILAAAAVACGRVSLPAYSNAARNRALGAPIHPHRLCRAPVPLTHSWVVIGMQAGRDEIREFQIVGRPPTLWSSGSIYRWSRRICPWSHTTNNQQSSAQSISRTTPRLPYVWWYATPGLTTCTVS